MSKTHPMVGLSRAFAGEGETTIVEAELALAGDSAEDTTGVGAFIGQLMVRNARENAALFESLYEGECRAHEETKQRLRRAHDRLDLIRRRVDWLLGAPDSVLWDEQ
jgi:hypothetical protein